MHHDVEVDAAEGDEGIPVQAHRAIPAAHVPTAPPFTWVLISWL